MASVPAGEDEEEAMARARARRTSWPNPRCRAEGATCSDPIEPSRCVVQWATMREGGSAASAVLEEDEGVWEGEEEGGERSWRKTEV